MLRTCSAVRIVCRKRNAVEPIAEDQPVSVHGMPAVGVAQRNDRRQRMPATSAAPIASVQPKRIVGSSSSSKLAAQTTKSKHHPAAIGAYVPSLIADSLGSIALMTISATPPPSTIARNTAGQRTPRSLSCSMLALWVAAFRHLSLVIRHLFFLMHHDLLTKDK